MIYNTPQPAFLLPRVSPARWLGTKRRSSSEQVTVVWPFFTRFDCRGKKFFFEKKNQKLLFHGVVR